eukprot:scaffold515504_cov94-Attheya_sp.AAC.1
MSNHLSCQMWRRKAKCDPLHTYVHKSQLSKAVRMTRSALYPGYLEVITSVSHCMDAGVGGAGRKPCNVSLRGES